MQQRLVQTGGRLVKHARHYWLLLAEGHLNRGLFGDMLRRIWALPLERCVRRLASQECRRRKLIPKMIDRIKEMFGADVRDRDP